MADSQPSAGTMVAVEDERILLRVERGGILIGERELRYQLQRKDNHPLAGAPELLDVLAELKDHGLIDSERCFRLTKRGRARLAELNQQSGG